MDDPNQHKMVPDDYEGNSPSQNENEKGYGNQDYMGEYNANNEYYNNFMEEEEDEQEGHLYAQNMSENRESVRREDYPEDESMEDEDSKFITENPNAGQRGGEDEDSAEYMEGDHVLNDDKDEEEEGEGDDMGESERYDYGNKGEKSESNFGKSINQANEDDEDQDQEQREDDEDDDADMDQIEGTKKIKKDISAQEQEGDGDGDGDGERKDGENEEPDSVQRDKGDNEAEEPKHDEERKEDGEKKVTGEPERRKGGRIPNRLKMLQVQNQGTLQGMTEEERIFFAIESAKRFNTKILGNRPKLQTYMKQIEKNRVVENVPIDLLGVPFPSSFVPVYMYDTNGTEYFSMNQAAQIERAPMGKFKRMNIENEGVTLVPEQFNLLKMEPGKRFQRRRKKRPMPVKPAEDSD